MPDVFTSTNLSATATLHPPAGLAVFGHPVAHSLSPQMHNPALEACGIEKSYVRVDVLPGEICAVLKQAQSLGFHGVNVTIPHKLEALQAVDEVEGAARKLGAVNTILFRNDGTLEGRNSDGPGFLRTVKEEFGVSVKDLRVLLLGAGGGAGGAVAVQCALEGCLQLVLTNRTTTKAETLSETLQDLLPNGRCRVVPWTENALREAAAKADLIINGTSLGMKPGDPPLLAEGVLQREHLVYDMVYKPLVTPLVAQARRAGAKAINGLPMLLWQGVQSFEWWFEREAPIAAMRAGLESAASAAALHD